MTESSLSRKVMDLLAGQAAASGCTKNEIARTLGVAPDDRAALRRTLGELVDAGKITEGQGRRYRLRTAGQRLLTGTVFIRPEGDGSFRPEQGDAENAAVLQELGAPPDSRVPVPREHLQSALHGDQVTVKVSVQETPAWKKQMRRRGGGNAGGSRGAPASMALQGRVVRILERRNQHIAGTLFVRAGHAWVIPDDTLLPNVDLSISGETEAKAGDKVVVSVDEWAARGQRLKGHLIKRLGRPGEKGVDVMGVIYKFHLPLEFPPAVLKETQAFPEEIPAEEIARREDCRRQHIITIDPFDARDFDDAIGVRELKDGGFELHVHIADVAHYVTPGSALDKEARARGNSTYLVDRVIPMLPERLSNGLCSLRPQEDKLTRFAVLTYNAKGVRTGQRFGAGVIRSSRRYTYEEAMASLKNPEPGDPDSDLLQRAWKLASMLRRRRYQNGALDLEFPEIKIILDERGVPVRLAEIKYDESHQLIEEFMLAANVAVAETLLRSGRPSVYRIHEDPDPSRLEELREVLAAAGIRTGDLTNRQELQKAIAAFSGRAEEPMLKLTLLKSLKRAVYSPDSLGHYGLNFEHYTHFTSPIRRYADLIVHRLLWNLTRPSGSAGTMKTPDYPQMKETAEHISTTERVSADAEMESRRLKELEYFERLASAEKPEPWECMVTRVLPFGLFIETTHGQIRGAIRNPDLGLPDPYYDAATGTLRNRRPETAIRAGDFLNAIPTGIDRERGTVNFRLLGVAPPAGKSGKKAQPAPAKASRRAAAGGDRPEEEEDAASGGHRERSRFTPARPGGGKPAKPKTRIRNETATGKKNRKPQSPSPENKATSAPEGHKPVAARTRTATAAGRRPASPASPAQTQPAPKKSPSGKPSDQPAAPGKKTGTAASRRRTRSKK